MTIRLKKYLQSGKEIKILQLIDVTNYILYMEFKAKNQFASIINACVSHELRNPLNSIIAKNIEKAALYEKILNHFFEFEPKFRETEAFKDCEKILEDLEKGRVIQQNSA